jgi:hypothetical protein
MSYHWVICGVIAQNNGVLNHTNVNTSSITIITPATEEIPPLSITNRLVLIQFHKLLKNLIEYQKFTRLELVSDLKSGAQIRV